MLNCSSNMALSLLSLFKWFLQHGPVSSFAAFLTIYMYYLAFCTTVPSFCFSLPCWSWRDCLGLPWDDLTTMIWAPLPSPSFKLSSPIQLHFQGYDMPIRWSVSITRSNPFEMEMTTFCRCSTLWHHNVNLLKWIWPYFVDAQTNFLKSKWPYWLMRKPATLQSQFHELEMTQIGWCLNLWGFNVNFLNGNSQYWANLMNGSR